MEIYSPSVTYLYRVSYKLNIFKWIKKNTNNPLQYLGSSPTYKCMSEYYTYW